MTDEILTVHRSRPDGSVPVLAAEGDIDLDSRHILAEAAGRALTGTARHLVLDLSAVTFCDSAGLGLLLDLHRLTESRGGGLRLAAVTPPVLMVIRATNLDRMLTLDPTVDAAVKAAQD